MDLAFDPAIPLMGIYPEKPRTLIQKNISTHMFIAALKIWKQPKCPSVDKTTMEHTHDGILFRHKK